MLDANFQWQIKLIMFLKDMEPQDKETFFFKYFDSRRYQIFLEVVGLDRGPLSLVRIIEELLE
jgi:hypothetical protein